MRGRIVTPGTNRDNELADTSPVARKYTVIGLPWSQQ